MPPQQPQPGGDLDVDLSDLIDVDLSDLVEPTPPRPSGFGMRQAGAAALRGAAAFAPPGPLGALAAGAVELPAQWLGGEDINLWQVPAQAAAGALKLGVLSKIPGFNRIPAIAQTAIRGMGLGATGQALTQQAREGLHVPTVQDLPEIGVGAGFGGVGGAAFHGIASRFGRKAPSAAPPPAPEVPIIPRDPNLQQPGESFKDFKARRPDLSIKQAQAIFRDPKLPREGETYDDYLKRSGLLPKIAAGVWERNPPPGPKIVEPKVGDKLPMDETTQKAWEEAKKKGYGPGGVIEEGPDKGKVFMLYKGNPVLMENIPLDPEKKDSLFWRLYNLPRGLMSIDVPFIPSALFRQAMPVAATREWFKAWGTAAKTYFDEDLFQQVMARINGDEVVRPGFDIRFKADGTPQRVETAGLARKAGIDFGIEESIAQRGDLAERFLTIKGIGYGQMVRASNRVYTAFLAELRLMLFKNLLKSVQASGKDPTKDLTVLKQIGTAVMDMTGRSPLKTRIPGIGTVDLEKNSEQLTRAFFSPRLIARNVRMLNPSTYMNLEPAVRKQYLSGIMHMTGGWAALAGAAQLSGVANVSLDPTNSDFGKIRIKGTNTRLDPGAGLQQWMVLFSRLAAGGTTSSVSGRFQPFGGTPSEAFKPETMGDTISRFISSKAHPTAKAMYDLVNAQQQVPFHVADRLAQLVVPMMTSDLMEVWKENPELSPLVFMFSSAGGGAQTYEKFETAPAFPFISQFGPSITRPRIPGADIIRGLR